MTPDVSDAYVEVPGGRIFLRRWSAATDTGSPIVLLHDSLGCADLWHGFPAALAAATRRCVIAYDRLGFGRSTARGDRPSAQFISEEAQTYFPALRAALGLARFVLFGHSVGGAMALTIAAGDGAGCEAVISESAQAFVEPRTLESIRAARRQFANAERFQRIAKWHGDKAAWVLDAWTEVWLSPQFLHWSLDQPLAHVRCPVLVIHGDSDEYGSLEFPRRIGMSLGGPSETAILEDCGHVPHRERPEEVLRLAREFLNSRGQASEASTP